MKINSVDKAITILNCFSLTKPVAGVGEISKITGFNPSTVSRLLSTLESRGVVEKVDGYGKYQLGYRSYLWGIISQKRNHLASMAKPIMEGLSDEFGEEVSLYILSDRHRVCLERVPSKHQIARVGAVGEIYPLHAGASGRVLLAYMLDEKRKAIINSGLERFTSETITDPTQLEAELSQLRRRGYAVSKAEREPGAFSVVAPVRNADGRVVASLCIAGPLFRLSEEQTEIYTKAVLQAAEQISKRLGCSLQSSERTDRPDSVSR